MSKFDSNGEIQIGPPLDILDNEEKEDLNETPDMDKVVDIKETLDEKKLDELFHPPEKKPSLKLITKNQN